MPLNDGWLESGSLKKSCVLLHWSGIAQAGDPGKQPGQLQWQLAAAGQVGEAQPTARSDHPRKLAGGSRLVRKCAEGALA